MPFLLTEDPSGVNDLSPRYKIGGLYMYHNPQYGWGLYRYRKYLSTAAIGPGDVLNYVDEVGVQVTPDRDETGFVALTCAGVAIGSTITTLYHGFAQVSGICTAALRTDGGVAAGDYIVAHTVDDEADTMADGEEEQVFAMSSAADGADNLTAGQALFKGLL